MLLSSNLTKSPELNFPDERYTILKVFEFLETTLAIIWESIPIIFSPTIELVPTSTLAGNTNSSNLGGLVSLDS